MAVVVLDGSQGEGGGQVVRTAATLATLMGQSVRIENVRANRPTQGLRRQHAGLLRFLAEWTGGSVQGADVGSSSVVFVPGVPRPVDGAWDIGTAGSVTLFLQAVLPVLLLTPGRSTLRVVGGTDVAYAPPWDWFVSVYAARVGKVADRCGLRLERRGFYPKGGGEVRVVVENPEGTFDMDAARERVAARLPDDAPPGAGGTVRVQSVASHHLAKQDVAARQAAAAAERLRDAGIAGPEVSHAVVPALSPGSVCTVWRADGAGQAMGGDRLGARDVRAETVGWDAASMLVEDVESGATVDRHLADHLVPWVALGAGAVRVPRTTGHLTTNLDTVRRFLGDVVHLDGDLLRGPE